MKTESEDSEATIRRLRLRLYAIEPVYRAAVELHKCGLRPRPEDRGRLEQAVVRAKEIERLNDQGWAISISDADLMERIQ